MDSRIVQPSTSKTNFLVDSVKRVLRIRHRIRVWVLGLLCVDEFRVDTISSVRKVDKVSASTFKSYPSIKAYGASDVISRAGIIESQPVVERYLLCARNAHIVGVYGLILTKYRQLITHRIGGIERTALQVPSVIFRAIASSFCPVNKHFEVVYNTHCLNTSNYYHWILEFLAGIQGYERACEIEGKVMPLLVQAPYMKRQREWLDLLGFDYVEVPPVWTSHFCSKKVYFASNEFAVYCNLDSGTINWLKHRFARDRTQVYEGDLPEKIFINRNDSEKSRGIVNSEEVESYLIDRNFTSITISEYSAGEQIELFQNAKIIVSEHGAALANLIFCEGCRVIEIFPCDYFNNDIAVLALNTDNQYLPVFGYDYENKELANKVKMSDLEEALLAPPEC